MNKTTTLPTLIASTTIIGAAYFFFEPIKAKVLKGLDKVKANKQVVIKESHDEVCFV